MIVRRIGYVGMRTKHLKRMTWFFRDVLGLREAMVGETFSILHLPTGAFDFAEVYSPGHHDERMIPDGVEGPVVAFVVDNLEAALREVKEAGLEVIGDVVRAAEAFGEPEMEGVGWFFLRAPDGRVYVVEQSVD
jgi:catechol 2,3-dioxygenase-like lactoylglutathione lyase family enzyme